MRTIEASIRFQFILVVVIALIIVEYSNTNAQQPWPTFDNFDVQHLVESDVQDIEWNATGQALAVATSSGLIILDVNLQPITQVHTGNLIHALSWNPLSNQIAITLGKSIEIWLWNVSSQTLVFERSLNSDQIVYGVFWSPNGVRIASLEIREDQFIWLGSIHVWNTQTWQSERVIRGNYVFELEELPTVQRLSWASNGSSHIAGVGNSVRLENGTYLVDNPVSIYIINVETSETRLVSLVTNDYATSLDWQPGGNLVAVSSRYGLEIYDLNSSQFVKQVGVPFTAYTVQWDASGEYISDGNSISRIDTDLILAQLPSTTLAGKIIDWKPDGYTLTIADFSNLITNWDSREFPNYVPVTPVSTLTPLPTAIYTITPSPTPAVTCNHKGCVGQ